MSFIEFESWEIKEGHEEAHHQIIRDWFNFVREHHPELFAEWKSARYFRETDREGELTGRYIMLFEFHTREGHHAYKARRDGYPGPYKAYEKTDPYQHFILDSVTVRYWEPQETELWFDYPAEA
ncbi:MAG: hypothetical protein KDE04_07155 [Anaerolineales bacterium]|nr:hypothetical protein [Anaerolineales bacterium]